MQELNEIATLKIKTMIEDGSIKELIHKNIESTMADVIKSSLKSYGEFGKALEESVKEAMCISGRNISLPEYNKYILQVVNDQFTNILEATAVDQLKELIAEVLEPVQKIGKSSKLINEIEKHWGDLAREQQLEEIKIDTEYNESNSAIYVTLHHPEYDWESLKVTFYNHGKDELWSIGYICQGEERITGRSIKRTNSHLEPITDMFFKYYAMNTDFEMDQEFESIGVCGY